MDIGKLYTTQISMTEWFEKIGHDKTTALREEDNNKRERLKIKPSYRHALRRAQAIYRNRHCE